MKKVIALKDYSDNYYILREGMIYNLIDSIADQLIEKEVCAISTGSPDDVVITQTVTSGTEIANVTINGQSTKLYAPINNSSNNSDNLFNFDSLIQQDSETNPVIKYISKEDIEEFFTIMPLKGYLTQTTIVNNSIQSQIFYYNLTEKGIIDEEIQMLVYGCSSSNFLIQLGKEEQIQQIFNNLFGYNPNTERYESGYDPENSGQTGGK